MPFPVLVQASVECPVCMKEPSGEGFPGVNTALPLWVFGDDLNGAIIVIC